MFMRRAGRTMIVTVLCGVLAAATAAPMALAQTRGASGLPSGSDNPIASLQRQVNELQQQMDALGAQVAAGGTSALGVFDKNGQRVGDVVGVQDNVPWVSLKLGDNGAVVLQVFPEQLVGQALWYDGTGCTGNPFIAGVALNYGPNVFNLAAVSEPGGVVYAAVPNATTTRVKVMSHRNSAGTCFNMSFTGNLLPASPVMTLDALFERGFSVR